MANKYEDRLKDYVQVNERIMKFYERYPEGSLQSVMVSLTDTLVVFKAFAYRSPTDERPGIGHSSLGIPGQTPYTEGSEIENAETSAWGRALAALGFEVKRGVASRDEIENKEKPLPPMSPELKAAAKDYNGSFKEATADGSVKATRIALIKKAKDKLGDELGLKWLKEAARDLGKTSDKLTIDEMIGLSERITKLAPLQSEITEERDIDF